MVSRWPEYHAELDFPKSEEEMRSIMEAIRSVRNRRAEMNVPPSRKARLYLETAAAETFERGKAIIAKLAYASGVDIGSSFQLEGAVTIVTSSAKLYIPMDELVDRAAELARLSKERESVQKQLDGAQARLNNPAFTSKAPEAVVATARENAERLAEKLALLDQTIESYR